MHSSTASRWRGRRERSSREKGDHGDQHSELCMEKRNCSLSSTVQNSMQESMHYECFSPCLLYCVTVMKGVPYFKSQGRLDTFSAHGNICVFYVPNLTSLVPKSIWPGTEGKRKLSTPSESTVGK